MSTVRGADAGVRSRAGAITGCGTTIVVLPSGIFLPSLGAGIGSALGTMVPVAPQLLQPVPQEPQVSQQQSS